VQQAIGGTATSRWTGSSRLAHPPRVGSGVLKIARPLCGKARGEVGGLEHGYSFEEGTVWSTCTGVGSEAEKGGHGARVGDRSAVDQRRTLPFDRVRDVRDRSFVRWLARGDDARKREQDDR
jgi:hypothetical protein